MLRLILSLALLFGATIPVSARPSLPAAEPRLVVFEGFFRST